MKLMNIGKATYLTLLYIKMINQTSLIQPNELSAFRRHRAFFLEENEWNALRRQCGPYIRGAWSLFSSLNRKD